MGTQYKTKERILHYMSWIYFFAFSSLYIQLPGLYGPSGVTPVHILESQGFPKDFKDFLSKPSILRFLNPNYINTYDALEYLVIANVILSAMSIIFVYLRTFQSFFFLWISYLTIYQYGQVFMYFQWDILLLEAGFLTVLLAQGCLLIIPLPRNASSNIIVMWLFKWLLFRLMFSSGIVKLQSLCPTWWDLSALSFHFQSQCLPTPIAYFLHQLPEAFLQFGVICTLAIEILVPFLFFFPFRPVRLFSFYSQLFLQVLIIASGNYNFFNLLTITICYSLLEDSDSGRKGRKSTTTIAAYIISFLLILSVFYITYQCINIQVVQGTINSFSLKFTKSQFKEFFSKMMPNIIYSATLLFALKLITSFTKAITSHGCMYKIWNFTMFLLIGSISIAIFTSSIYSFSVLDANTRSLLPVQAKRVYKELEPLEVTNNYGLFRRMTGVPKRPELVLEAAMSEQGPWVKLDFHHKPTDLVSMPSLAAPHQPRLDWQMWFAALSTPKDHPWLYNFIYRILKGEKEVLQLIKSTNLKSTPKFIRASLYEYEFTKYHQKSLLWWSRNRKSTYLEPISLSDANLIKIITSNGLLTKEPKASKKTILTDYKNLLRDKVGQPSNIYPGIMVIILIKITQKFMAHK